MTLAIVTTVHNMAHFLPESVASVRAQTVAPDEYIVVDDGSTDNPALPNEAIRIKLGHNQGHPHAVNRAVMLAHTEWILKVDADDTIHPQYVEEILRVSQERPDINVIFAPCTFFGNQQGTFRYPEFDPSRMCEDLMIPGNAAFKRSAWWAIGGLDESMRYGSGWDVWVRMHLAVGLKPYQLREPRWSYRMHDGPRLSRDGIADVTRLKAYWRGHTKETVKARSRTWSRYLDGLC